MKLVSQLSFDIRHSLFIIRYSLFGSGLSGLRTGEFLPQIELQRESLQTAFDYLSESYAILQKTGRLDGICWVVIDLGKLLCRAGNTETGIKILEQSRTGFLKLGQENLAQQTQELMDGFSKEQ